MKKKILQTIREHDLIKENMHVVVGLSGGPDSMCLFDVLEKLAKPEATQDQGESGSAPGLALKLYPVHVNHRFRPGAAEEDQAFVEKFCRDRGWPCRSFVVDCNAMAEHEGLTSEEAGRKARYQAFRQVADEIVEGGVKRENVVIAVAQNANDQCETILFRLLRGTGVDGIAGIAYKRWDESGTAVVRPLLDVSREEIEEYCETNHLAPRRDHTNAEPTYARNRIRLELIPFLKKNYSQNVIDVVNRLGELAAVDREYLWMQAEEAYQKAHIASAMKASQAAENKGPESAGRLQQFAENKGPGAAGRLRQSAGSCEPADPSSGLPELADMRSGAREFADMDRGTPEPIDLDCDVLLALHPAIRSRVYGRALREIGLTEDVTAAHIAGLDRILESGRPSATWNLPAGFVAVRRYGVLRLQRRSEDPQTTRTVRLLQIGDTNDMGDNERRCAKCGENDNERRCAECSEGDNERRCAECGENLNEERGDSNDMGDNEGRYEESGDASGERNLSGVSGRTDMKAGRPEQAGLRAIFDLDALQAVYGEGAAQQITLRRRQQGDYMQIRIGGALHRKKLQDILVDMKVPREDRDRLLLAAIGKEILWILPAGCEGHVKIGKNGRFSAAYSVSTDQTIRRIVLEYL